MRQTQFVEGESFQLLHVNDVIARSDEVVGSIARLTPRMPGTPLVLHLQKRRSRWLKIQGIQIVGN